MVCRRRRGEWISPILSRSPKTAAHHPRAFGQLGKRSRECFFCLERPRPSSLSLSLSFIQLLSALVCLSRNEPHIPIYDIKRLSLSPAACRYIEVLYIEKPIWNPPTKKKISIGQLLLHSWVDFPWNQNYAVVVVASCGSRNFSLHSGLTSCPIDIPSTGLPSPMTSLTGIISRPSIYIVQEKWSEKREQIGKNKKRKKTHKNLTEAIISRTCGVYNGAHTYRTMWAE